MRSIVRLSRLAHRFDQQIRLAQKVFAQPGEIETVLKKANLWELDHIIAPLINTVGIPNSSSIEINIIASDGLIINFDVKINPENVAMSKNLSKLLTQKLSAQMQNALKEANLSVEGFITVKWKTF